jgi:hypothetical protein
MLSEFLTHLPVSFGFVGDLVHAPSGADVAHAALRWTHFVAGITWIGLLYFFNLVNVRLQKNMDADTKKKVNPELLSRTLWYFRWGAVVTVLAGLTYYAMYILAVEARNAGLNPWTYLGIWLVLVLVTYAIMYGLYQVPALTKDGRVLAVVIAILIILFSVAVIYILGNAEGEGVAGRLGNKSISIGIGGGYGIMMMPSRAKARRPRPQTRAKPSWPRAQTPGSPCPCSSSWARRTATGFSSVNKGRAAASQLKRVYVPGGSTGCAPASAFAFATLKIYALNRIVKTRGNNSGETLMRFVCSGAIAAPP